MDAASAQFMGENLQCGNGLVLSAAVSRKFTDTSQYQQFIPFGPLLTCKVQRGLERRLGRHKSPLR